MKNWIKDNWLSLLLWAILIGLCVFILTPKASGQSFEQIGSYPYVVTSIKYDSAGNEYVTRQQGSLTKNQDTIKVFPVKFQNESGLVDFDFAPNGFYLHLSSPDNAQRIIEYDTTTGTLDTILTVPYTNSITIHRGGSVALQNGVLYASFGDGAIAWNAQILEDYRGKLVKIDTSTSVVDIVLFGLRNPYRFAFKPGTNEGFVTDVGNNIAEEVNYLNGEYSLLNLMWPCAEGDSILLDLDSCGGYAYSYPEYWYSQAAPRSIIGGCFWNDKYYFCDNFTGVGGSIFLDTAFHIDTFPILFPEGVTSMTVNPQNELVVSTWIGTIYKYIEGPLSIDEEEEQPNLINRKGIYLDGKRISWEPNLTGQLVIYSLEGRVIFTTDLADQEYLEYVDLPSGFYVMAVYTERGIQYSKAFVNIKL